MDRREALNLLPEMSAGCLDAKTEAAVRRWVEECPECQVEWRSLQTMMEAVSTSSQPLLTAEQSQRLWQRCSEGIYDKTEARRLAEQNPSLWAWMTSQPRWGWAMLGGAALVLGAAWISNPDSSAPTNAPVMAAAGEDVGQLQVLRRPPSYAATMVDHHAQMAMDPFTDHVGSSLVSYSASMPPDTPQK